MLRRLISSIVMVSMVVSSVMWQTVAVAAPLSMSQIYSYAKAGNLKALQSLKQTGNSLEMIDKYGNTALCRSIWMKDYASFFVLKKAGASTTSICVSKIPVEQIQSFNTNYTAWAEGVNSGKIAYPVKEGERRKKAAGAYWAGSNASATSSGAYSPTIVEPIATETGLSTGAKVAIGVGAVALIGGGIALAAGGGGGGGSSGSDNPNGGNGGSDSGSSGGSSEPDTPTPPPQDLCANVNCGSHGTCNASTGACNCTDGYTGGLCQVAPDNGSGDGDEGGDDDPDTPTPPVVDLCANVNCGSHGTCNPTDGSCTCADGYTGALCQVAPDNGSGDGDEGGDDDPDTPTPPVVDLCANMNCGSHGTCNAGTGECDCTDGYTGALCQVAPDNGSGDGDEGGDDEPDTPTPPVVDLCVNMNCGSHGTCNASTGECDCIGGYSGALCQVAPDLCANVTCGTNQYCNPATGRCVDYSTNLCANVTCGENQYCNPTTGQCVKIPCSDVDCGVHGVCLLDTETCFCRDGYSGSACQIPPSDLCAYVDCGDHGTCNSADGSCTCRDGWTGLTCLVPPADYDACEGISCNGHGTCYDGECFCDDGYEGANCQIKLNPNICDGVTCNGRGDCDELDGTCWCDDGWTGDYCEISEEKSWCDTNGCGIGICNESTKSCTCVEGWSGPNCTIPPSTDSVNLCANKNCGAAGYCVTATGECQCAPGYSGEGCRTITMDPFGFCQNVDCGSHGVCDIYDGSCLCDGGYDGALCRQANVCTNINCGSHGSCNESTGMCDCDSGYTGAYCQTPVDLCANVNCGEHGTCNPTDGSCTCNDGWTGDDCKTEVTEDLCKNVRCGSHSTCDETTGNCVCDSGYISWEGACYVDMNCPENSIQQETSCVCNEGYVDFSGVCYVKIDCPTNEEQLKDQCVCSSGFGRDSTGTCVTKSSDVVGKQGDETLSDDVVNASGINITNNDYADVWGMRDGRLINNNTITITNNGDGDVTGMYSNSGATDPQDIFNARAVSGTQNAYININTKGDGDVVGMRGGAHLYNAANFSNDDGEYESATANGYITIVSEGNNSIEGIANEDVDKTVLYNALARYGGSANAFIDITSIGDAWIVGGNALGHGAYAVQGGIANSSIKIQSTGSNRFVAGMGGEYANGSSDANAYAQTSSSSSTDTSKAIGNISLTIRDGGSDLRVVGVGDKGWSNAIADASSTKAQAISRGTVTIDHQGKGTVTGISNSGGTSYNARTKGYDAEATGIVSILSEGDAQIVGVNGLGNAHSSSTEGYAEGIVNIISKNSTHIVAGLMGRPVYSSDPMFNAYTKNGLSSIGEVNIKTYNAGSVYGFAGENLYNAIAVYSDTSAKVNPTAKGYISLFSDSSYVAGMSTLDNSDTFLYNAYAKTDDSTYKSTATGVIDITHVGVGRVRGMIGSNSKNITLYNAYGSGATGVISIKKSNIGQAIGMFAGDQASATNNSNSSISITSSDNAAIVGMWAGLNATVVNGGTITLTHSSFTDVDGNEHTSNNAGSLAVGIYAKAGSTVTNNGTISITGFETAYGIYAESGAKVNNSGTIVIDGISNSENAIKLDGAELINSSEISSTTALNLSAFGGKTTLTENGKLKAPEILGDLHISNDVVSSGFKSEYQLTEAIESDDITKLNISSQSAMFDASLNSTSDTTHDIVMTRKAFDQVMSDQSVATFLENNYAQGNNEALFNSLKAAPTTQALNAAWAKASGTDTLANFAYEDFAALRSLNHTMNDALFTKKGDIRSMVGYDHLYQHRNSKGGLTGYSSDADSTYALTDRAFNDFRFGLGMAVTRYNGDYKNDSDRTETVYQAFAPIGFEKAGFKVVSVPRVGYANGHYTRTTDGASAKGKTEKWLYGLTNEVRYPMTIAGLTIEPAAEFNILGWHTKGHSEDNAVIRAAFKSDNQTSVEAGLGLYLRKEMNIGESSRLNMRAGGAWYYEMAKPYGQKMSLEGMTGDYRMEDWMLGRHRGQVSGEIGYDYKNIGLYAKFTQFIENDTRFNMNAGIRVGF